MNMTNISQNTCRAGSDVLAYLCGDLSPEGRDRFESHIEACDSCVDELAELSFPLYSVHEWKNVEFAPLATPRFVVPIAEPVRASWLQTVPAAFAWKGLAVAGGLAVVLFVAIGFILLRQPDNDTVAVGVESFQPDIDANTSPVRVPEDQPQVVVTNPATDSEPATVPKPRTASAPRAVTTANSKQVRRSPVRTSTVARTTNAQRLQNSPTLAQYAEDRDESLRLSDLFDDFGTRERE